ncbi:MAG: hypothetical protein HQL52_14650 [Magnetococcales bacterium]|nr:hypothetical protein [Magnetococcales bacterium]
MLDETERHRIDKILKNLNLEGIKESDEDKENGKFVLKGNNLGETRKQLIIWLNALEIAATAWNHHIGDREIIEVELRNFISSGESFYLGEIVLSLRYPFYPSLKEMVIDVNNRNRSTGKEQID